MLRLALALVLALCIAGCGSATGARQQLSSVAQLHITVWPEGETGAKSVYTLNCPTGKGTLPAGRATCKKLSHLSARAFAPVPTGTACTLIYGGPEKALVTGRYSGKTIRAVFSRTDGCQIARWSRVAFLFSHGLASR
ncbi:MAG: hypothetical protein ABSB96_10430 [Gaiellaceae bacterium]